MKKKVTVVIPVTRVVITCSEAMSALRLFTLQAKCLKKIVGRSAQG